MSEEVTSQSPLIPRSRDFWLRNGIAGTTTAVVLVPQAMAYALVAGLPPIHGLYASLLPLIVYAAIGRSRQLAVGPGAIDTLLVGAALGGLAFVNEANYVGYAALLALLVGGIQLALGALRAGFLINFLSRPVVSGFTSAAAILIALSQVRNLLGYEAASALRLHEQALQIATNIGSSNPATVAVGMSSIALLVGLKKWNRRMPYALAAVIVAIVASSILHLPDMGVDIVGPVPAGLPPIVLPDLSWEAVRSLLPTALAIAFVGYLTMISIAQTFANRNRYVIRPNRELFAAGAANLAAGVSSAFPISGSFSRSAVNAEAGATSAWSLVFAAGWIAVTLLLFTELFTALPKATLAAIIITAVIGLIDMKTVRRLKRVKSADMWLLVVTFLATLFIGIEPGILIGVGASLAFFVYRSTRPHTAVLGRIDDSRDYRNVKNYPEARVIPGVLILRIDAQFYYGNVTFLRDTLRRLEARSTEPLSAIVIEACSLNQLDSSAADALSELVVGLHERDVRFVMASVKMPVARVLEASGLTALIGEENFFMNVHDAVVAVTSSATQSTEPAPA